MEVNWGLGSPLKERHMHIDVLPEQLSLDVYASERAKKEAGMLRAANANGDMLAIFRSIAVRLSCDNRQISIDDVRKEAERVGIKYTPGNYLGSIFKGAHWDCCGFKPSTHAGSHGRMVRVWRIKQDGKE